MKGWKNLRILAEGRFVLGAGVGGCAVGAVVSLLLPPLPWVEAPLAPFAQITVRLAHGVGLGWWAGVFWGVFTTLLARSQPRRPEVRSLASLAWWAAAAVFATLGGTAVAGLPPKARVFLALLAALLATRAGLAWASRDHR
ncbi:MAG: hypothetical protein NZ869_02990 [Thermoanaerobaculum sp.]|nr:hypothetical protein [Thermoanaerobaculum sp.]MDW7967557.1 hypothetical protein [Thermoanaerobaculum sp.]